MEIEEPVFRHRNLPHHDVVGHPIFITGCLEGSIPAAGYKRIAAFRKLLDGKPKPPDLSTEAQWQHRKNKQLFAFVDKLLDFHSPVNHLSDPGQALVVRDSILHFADERHHLLAFVVMPSHHHWLFMPRQEWLATLPEIQQGKKRKQTPREIISHSVQSYTGSQCNKVRGASGNYWQHETYDHWSRDDDETSRIIDYIESNPVKSQLVDHPEDWEYSSAPLQKNWASQKAIRSPKRLRKQRDLSFQLE